MISAEFLFRGNFMNEERGRALLERLMSYEQLVPSKWGLVEPKTPFELSTAASAFNPAGSHAVSWIVFLSRKKHPAFHGGIFLARIPVHNSVFLQFNERPDLDAVRSLLEGAVSPTVPDFAFITDADEQDTVRFAEAYRPYTPQEVLGNRTLRPPFVAERSRSGERQRWFTSLAHEMRGPHGWLWDVLWYNYFGPPYVELIGKGRLLSAGWSRVEEVGPGIACYATERIDDPESFESRSRIRANLEEFYWTPGCTPEQKHAPVFDFSDHTARVGDQRAMLFAGFTEAERQQAISELERATHSTYDPETGAFTPVEQPKPN